MEPRILLSAQVYSGILFIDGGETDDAIELTTGNTLGAIIVAGVPGVADGTPFFDFTSIQVRGLAGNDSVRVGNLSNYGLPDIEVDGGAGSDVVIVERDPARARELAEQLENCLVLEGDITDDGLLEEADIGRFEMVVALTGEDDANILACLYAKDRGAQETVAVLHRLALLPLVERAGVDVALSPRTATANAVLRFVRGGVAAVATFLHGDAEILELEVAERSPADGALINELGLPKDALIAAFVRDGNAQIGRATSRLRAHDHVVVVAMPGAVDEVHGVLG